MHSKARRWISICALAVCALVLGGGLASTASAASQKTRQIDESNRVPSGNVHPLASAQADAGPADLNLSMERMILSLKLRPRAQARLDKLIAAQHDPKSPLYHHWLTPEQFGAQFGLSDDDLASVTSWLTGHGFRIDEVAKGRGWINFSGTARQVERAFSTEIHQYVVDGKVHHANSVAASIPRALSDVVNGVVTLHDFPRPAHNGGFKSLEADPDYTSGTSHYVSPADFATIYNLNSAYSSGYTGTGRTVAIVGRTDIKLADVQYFRTLFGLPANDPTFVHNGTAPGVVSSGEETEADLDVEWSGAVAKNAALKFVISKSTASTDGVDLSAQYIVNNNLADSMSTSFGQCESSMGSTENTFYNNIWTQAATQGITSFVSAGDSGAAGCNGGSDTTGSGRAVSGLCSPANTVCIGGTQFNEGSNASTYWSSTNSSVDGSALSYIPEVAWNESANVSGGSGLWSTGGGASTIYAKPSWQTGTGVPADGKRDIPDISLTAASHDGYLIIQGHTSTASGLGAVGGTSASSPAFAGLMGLIVQKTGARQGNANTVFYPMRSSTPAAFHDITSGNNSVPGVTGFTAGTGYDQATGLGTVDATALITNWGSTAPTPDFAISASPTSLTQVQGTAGSSTITASVSGGFNSAVALTASGAPTGTTVSFSPASIAAPGSGTSTMTVTVGASTAVGSYTITVTGTGGSKTHTATVALTVNGSGGGSQQLLGNPGFENGTTSTPWVATTGVIDSSTGEAAHAGSWKAWLDGYGSTHTDTLYQQVTIPSTVTTATLTFWVHIDSAETTTSTAYDTLTVQLRNSSNTVLTTLATYSNLNKATGYAQKSFNVSAYKGQTIRVYLTGKEDVSLQTSFVVDDFALNVQ